MLKTELKFFFSLCLRKLDFQGFKDAQKNANYQNCKSTLLQFKKMPIDTLSEM